MVGCGHHSVVRGHQPYPGFSDPVRGVSSGRRIPVNGYTYRLCTKCIEP